MRDFHETVIIIGFYSYYLPITLVAYLLLTTKQLTKFDRLLFFFVFYNAVIVFVEQFVLDGKINNYNPIYNIQTIVDFCTIILLFSIILKDFNQKIKTQFNYLILLFILISIFELLFIHDLYSINIYANSIAKLLIIIIATITIYLSEIKITITRGQKIFTYTILFYSIATLPIALFEQFIRYRVSDYFYLIWSLNILFVTFYNLFLTLSLWKLKK
jgi:hypothetical protein